MKYFLTLSNLAFICFFLIPGVTDPVTAQNAKHPDRGTNFTEELVFTRTGKLLSVVFKHASHADSNSCAVCHEGEKPIFEKKKADTGYLMADMYGGKTCGTCHNGKKAFEVKKSCAKCHSKAKEGHAK